MIFIVSLYRFQNDPFDLKADNEKRHNEKQKIYCNKINNKIRNLLFHSTESSQGLSINVGIINLVV